MEHVITLLAVVTANLDLPDLAAVKLALVDTMALSVLRYASVRTMGSATLVLVNVNVHLVGREKSAVYLALMVHLVFTASRIVIV